MKPRASSVVLVALLLGLSVPVAYASPLPGEILSLGVKQVDEVRGKARGAARELETHLSRSLSEHLARSGVLSKAVVGGADRACRAQECLDQLTQRSGAVAIIGVNLTVNEDGSYYVDAWLFDGAQHQTEKKGTSCARCERGKLADMINENVGFLLTQRQAGPTPEPPPPPRRPAPPPAVAALPLVLPAIAAQDHSAPKPEPICPRGSKCRKGLAISFGTLAVGGLASLISLGVLNLYDGRANDGPCPDKIGMPQTTYCFWAAKPDAILGTSIAGGVAVGVGVTGLILALVPPRQARTKEVRR